MSKIKVGDRVKAVRDKPTGYEGEVVFIKHNDLYLVKFDAWIGGYSGQEGTYKGESLGGSGWWLTEGDLELLSTTPPPHKYKVGDTVRAVGESRGWGHVKRGDVGKIVEVVNGSSNYKYWVNFSSQKNWQANDRDLELVKEGESSIVAIGVCLGEVKNNKDKIKKFMCETKENIVKFAKNLTLSNIERLAREVGLKDDEGRWTGDAESIVLDLEAKERGYTNFNNLTSVVTGCGNPSVLEMESLYKKHESALIEIAKKSVATSKK